MEAGERLERKLGKARERSRRYRERKKGSGFVMAWVPSEGPQPKMLTPESLRELVATSGRKSLAKAAAKLDEWGEAFRDHFWPDYLSLGRACSVSAALKAWMAVPHSEGQEAFDELWADYEAIKAEWAKRSDVTFIPHAASWLNKYARDRTLKNGGMF